LVVTLIEMVEKHGEHSHKTIIKAISVFGFTQVMKMLIAIVGSKFVAVFLGPVGIGTVALLNNTVALISSLTGFGINITGIREMALAHAENNAGKFSERFAVLQRLSLFIGLIGAIITILFSPLLSKWTFGTSILFLVYRFVDELHVFEFVHKPNSDFTGLAYDKSRSDFKPTDFFMHNNCNDSHLLLYSI